MVLVKVQVQVLSIDIVPGDAKLYRFGDVFECPEDRAVKLGNSVKILEPEPIISEPPEIQPNPPKRKRR